MTSNPTWLEQRFDKLLSIVGSVSTHKDIVVLVDREEVMRSELYRRGVRHSLQELCYQQREEDDAKREDVLNHQGQEPSLRVVESLDCECHELGPPEWKQPQSLS